MLNFSKIEEEKVTMEHNALLIQLKKIFVSILLLFLCSIPVFFLMVSLDTNAYIYMSARILRFLLVIVIGCFIRKRNQKILNTEMLKMKFDYLILGIIIISLLLHYTNITPSLYGSISYSIGVYNLETTPLFLAVLWEQLFSGDLYWSILLCLSIVFLDCPTPIARKYGEIIHDVSK